MEAALRQNESFTMEQPLIDPNWRNGPFCTVEEAFEKAYKHLGELYGLNDIREAK